MKKQTTKQELNGAIGRLNSCLSESGFYVKVGHRNGYTALDLHRSSDDGMKDYLTTEQTDKKMLQNVYLMIKAIGLIQNPLINK